METFLMEIKNILSFHHSISVRVSRLFKVVFWIAIGLSMNLYGVASAIDLSVISNRTGLMFKLAYIPLTKSGSSSQTAQQAQKLILRDLKESGYFDVSIPAPDVVSKLQTIGFTGEGTSILASGGYEGVAAASVTEDGTGTHVMGVVRDPVSGKVLLSKEYTTSGAARHAVHRFVDDVIYQFTGLSGIAMAKIAFIGKNPRRGYDLYAMDFDGEGLHRLTFDHVLAYSPAWSLKTHHIEYVSYLHMEPQILSYDLRTGRRTALAKFPGLNITPDFSRDGIHLAVALSKGNRAQRTEIYVTTLKDKKFNRLTFSRSNNLSPSWSPSGNQIAFVSDRDGHPQVFVMDSDGTNVHRVTFNGFYNVSPAWGPSGDLISFVCMNDRHRPKICLTTPDGSRSLQITHGRGQDDSPDWSPDGRTIIYAHQVRGKSVMMKMFLDGSHNHRLGRFPRDVITPMWAVP
jgi:TolB protein